MTDGLIAVASVGAFRMSAVTVATKRHSAVAPMRTAHAVLATAATKGHPAVAAVRALRMRTAVIAVAGESRIGECRCGSRNSQCNDNGFQDRLHFLSLLILRLVIVGSAGPGSFKAPRPAQPQFND
jgi:hypothetical protein